MQIRKQYHRVYLLPDILVLVILLSVAGFFMPYAIDSGIFFYLNVLTPIISVGLIYTAMICGKEKKKRLFVNLMIELAYLLFFSYLSYGLDMIITNSILIISIIISILMLIKYWITKK